MYCCKVVLLDMLVILCNNCHLFMISSDNKPQFVLAVVSMVQGVYTLLTLFFSTLHIYIFLQNLTNVTETDLGTLLT